MHYIYGRTGKEISNKYSSYVWLVELAVGTLLT